MGLPAGITDLSDESHSSGLAISQGGALMIKDYHYNSMMALKNIFIRKTPNH